MDIGSMIINLDTALTEIAYQLELNPIDLIAYASEWNRQSCSTHSECPHLVDRKILYALIRAIEPKNVLEAGTNIGAGANVILTALEANGNHARLTTVDILPNAGEQIEGRFNNVTVVMQDIVKYASGYAGEGFDFIHEDASHEVHTVRVVYDYLHRLAPTGCVIISHDVATGVGEAIRTGIKDAGYGPLPEYKPEGSLGYTVMRYKGEQRNV
jgi:predicted O-methyltransferase YrrM